MIATAIGCTVQGITGIPVTVEADVVSGLPQFTIVGLTDRAIQEARERVKAAVRNSGFKFPDHRVTVNLAPAEVPKEGTGFDLAIALAVLGVSLELRLDGKTAHAKLGNGKGEVKLTRFAGHEPDKPTPIANLNYFAAAWTSPFTLYYSDHYYRGFGKSYELKGANGFTVKVEASSDGKRVTKAAD